MKHFYLFLFSIKYHSRNKEWPTFCQVSEIMCPCYEKEFFITKCVSETKRFTIISLSVSALHTWDNNYKLKSQKYELLLESSYL